jgi:hypothetical protein
MILIESNSAMRWVQDRIFILRVLFGLVMTQLSCANNSAAESMLDTEVRCLHRVMLVMTLPSHVGDGAADRQGVIADHQGATTDRQGVITSHRGATADYPSVAEQQRRGHRLSP